MIAAINHGQDVGTSPPCSAPTVDDSVTSILRAEFVVIHDIGLLAVAGSLGLMVKRVPGFELKGS